MAEMIFKKHAAGTKRGFTLVELLFATALSAVLTGLLIAAFMSSSQVCTTVTKDQDLQQTANVIMNKIIKGASESGVIYRLSEAKSYTIASISDLHFVGIDGVDRRYFLSNAGNELWYTHPGGGVAGSDLIYRAPTGTTLTLRFWPLAGAAYTNITVGIDVGLAKAVNGRNVVGSVTTMINIRNHVT